MKLAELIADGATYGINAAGQRVDLRNGSFNFAQLTDDSWEEAGSAEVVVTREALAQAWDASLPQGRSVAPSAESQFFQRIVTRLGL